MIDDITLPANGSFSFAGRTAIVTGAGSGVGEGIARELHVGGCKVVVSDMNLPLAQSVAQALDPGGETAFALELDVREKAHFIAALDAIVARWGKLDIVINNAGKAQRTPTPDITPEEFDEITRINMRSVFLSAQVFSPHLVENGYGRIVNITSLAGQNGGTVASPHYAAAKAGANMLTKYFARSLAGTGVTVNGICPGPIDSAKQRMTPETIARVESEVPIGRFMRIDEIAAAAALLASDRGGFFMGATLDINGGLYLR
jgi:3-oxoacyl-[acyl-carrier protein] reductase